MNNNFKSTKTAKFSFYAVRVGKTPGIYKTWYDHYHYYNTLIYYYSTFTSIMYFYTVIVIIIKWVKEDYYTLIYYYYNNRDECKAQTEHFQGAKFKGFINRDEAQAFVGMFFKLYIIIKIYKNEYKLIKL